MKFKYYHSQKIARVYVLRYLLIRLEKYVTKTAAVTIKKKKKRVVLLSAAKKKIQKRFAQSLSQTSNSGFNIKIGLDH